MSLGKVFLFSVMVKAIGFQLVAPSVFFMSGNKLLVIILAMEIKTLFVSVFTGFARSLSLFKLTLLGR